MADNTQAAPAASTPVSATIQPELTAAEQDVLKNGIGDTNEDALIAAAAAEAQAKIDADAATAATAKAAVDAEAATTAEAARARDDSAARAAAAAAQVATSKPPEPAMDFKAEYAKVRQEWDDGKLDDIAKQERLDDIAAAKAAHATRVANWENDQRARESNAQAVTEQSWHAAQLSWQREHSDFISDAARVERMREWIPIIEAKSPGISNDDLLRRAYTAAKMDLGYAEPVIKTPAQLEADRIAALRARDPRVEGVQTLRDLPSSGGHQTDTNASFAKLDALPINDLENVMAHMTQAQRDAYLLDAPGAMATGRE